MTSGPFLAEGRREERTGERIRVVRLRNVQLRLMESARVQAAWPCTEWTRIVIECARRQSCNVSRSWLSQPRAQIGRRDCLWRPTSREHYRHTRRASAPLERRHSSRSKLAAGTSRQYECRGTPGANAG